MRTRAAIGVNVPGSGYQSSYDTLNVAGKVTGTGQPGVALYAGSNGGANLALTVAAGGSVSGNNAVLLAPGSGASSYFSGTASVDNSGILTGTGGIALLANGSGLGFGTITSRAGGTIGAISGPIGTLTNAGVIDGGATSAIGSSPGYAVYGNIWTNTGAIRSVSNAATIQIAASTTSVTLTNSGTILNGGSGAAISGGLLTVSNQAGGRIGSAGTTAINATIGLNLVNLGAITGDVVATAQSGYTTKTVIDSSAGTVTGSLRLGVGDDTLVARYTGGRALATGFTGTVDGGGGTNTEQVAFTANTSVTTPIDLATNFQLLGLKPATGITATLTSGFSTTLSVVLAGTGSVLNRGTIATNGQAVLGAVDVVNGSLASFSNEGSISGSNGGMYSPNGLTYPGQFAVQLANVSNFSNSGTITARGNAVFQQTGTKFANSGTITASGIAVAASNTAFVNTGTITSTGSTGAQLGADTSYQLTNSGVIRGSSIGVDLGASLTNTGTIGSTGTGVLLEGYATLINAAGGVVTGGTRAVSGSSFASTLVNAGTINGDVVFDGTYSGFNSANRYIAQSGGVLNGNLTLGASDLLLTDLVNTGPGQFAGVTGTVKAQSGAQLRLRVGSNASASLGPVGPFAIAGYELSNNAKLTLTGSGTQSQTLLLAGTGSVDVNANFAVSATPAIQSTSVVSMPGTSSTPATALAITSRGTISITRANGAPVISGGAVTLGANDSFTNAGTINVVDRNSFSYTYGVTASGGTVTNSGAIRLDGGYGVSGAGTLNNTGTITQIAGGLTAQGVVNTTSVINSGTISVGGAAVQLSSYGGQSVLTNSGLVASSGGAAVTAPYAYNGVVTNLAGGTIRGGAGTAIQLAGATLTNAGSIVGTVDLGYGSATYRSSASASYIAAGGTITGDLLFGTGSDVFLQTGATTGVSGRIDGGTGSGRNLYGLSLTGDGTFALDTVPVVNLQDRLAQAIGTGTTVTTTGILTGDLYATGTGTIANQAAVTGRLLIGQLGSYAGLLPTPDAPGSVVNTGTITAGVSGATPSFTNTGTIGAARLLAPAVSLTNSGALSFTNGGQITANASSGALGSHSVVELSGVDTVSIVNSGTVQGVGGMLVTAQFSGATTGTASVTNSGLITSTNGQPSLHVITGGSAGAGAAGASLGVTNTGTLATTGGYAYGAVLSLGSTGAPLGFSFSNSGAITATATNTSSVGLVVYGDTGIAGAVSNAVGGRISASAPRLAVALFASGTPLVLDNAGLIAASGGMGSIAVQAGDPFNNIVRNTGAITGDVVLGDGANRVENAGALNGNVYFGAGNDVFVQRGGTVTGVVDGAAGANLLQVDATGGGAVSGATFTNFGRVQQINTGTMAYSGAFGAGTIELAGGTLSVAGGQTLSTAGATTITGTGGGVSIVNAGTIAGGVTLGDGGNSVTNSGAIGGPVLLGAGNDSFRLTSGATLGGVVDGGAGSNSLTLALSSDLMLKPGVFRNFQSLTTEGASTLILAGGAFQYDRVSAAGNLAIASDASLSAPVTFGAGDNRFSIAGGFTGSVDGGAGNDTVEVSGGTQAAPVAFGAISNVENYRQTSGFATLSGVGNVGAMYLGGGRFVGLGGSTLTATQIGIDTGATFGSAGVVNGNITVAGTLSPGASPGTMTVNGNVALLGGSVSLFELTPALSDKLVVNGNVGIAPGATLQLAPTGFSGGGALDLVTATGGVSGAFTSVVKPASLNGFLSYQATRIQFVTAFTGDTSFTPQTARALAYTNGVLTSGQASATLLAGLPRLLTGSGASNASAFNRITPEAYASTQQIGVDSGLALSESARGAGFAAPVDRRGAFTFGELQGDWTRLPGNASTGASPVEASAQGLLGGVGVGTGSVSVGAFAGYRWSNQRIAALGARTRHDGTVAGVQARVAAGAFALVATGAYDGGDAVTTRAVPDGTARARYGLHGWTGDLSASYALALGANWRLEPHVGGTVIRDIRDRAAETGGSGFALSVARGRERASFVDGGVGVEGGAAPGARFHPFVSLGARWQLEGRDPLAVAGFGGGATSLVADGAQRAKLVGTGTLGVAADVAPGLALFASATGEAATGEHRIAARAGLRGRF